MGKKLQNLQMKQNNLRNRMAQSVSDLEGLGAANITLAAAETCIGLLDGFWAKFEAQHELIIEHLEDAFEESEYNSTRVDNSARVTYITQRSLLLDYVRKLKTKEPSSASKTEAIEKFHYLKTCLEGPAEELIRPLAVTRDNYSRAWELLSEQYENKRELSRSNFFKFTAVAKMKSETEEELNRIFNVVTRVVNDQESIDRPIGSHGFDLLNHLVVELFDPRTRLESLSSASSDMPTHKELMNFINKRARTLKAAKAKSLKVSDNPSRSAKSHHVKKHTESSQCVLCKGMHHVMVCEEFKKKSAVDRKAVAKTHRLCFNCLGSHTFAKCQSTRTCSTCKDVRFGDLYRAFLKEYEDQGHMELAQESPNSSEDRCYLPHHSVLRESSTTTKLKVVFNGSQRTKSVILWSDSKVTLHWIRGHASRWKTYVANRVSRIQQQLPEAQWRPVPGNPADCASRGLTPRELLSHPLWWTGPAWLCGNPTQWPSVDQEPIKDVPEQCATTLAAVIRSNHEPEELLRFSSLHQLLRVTSWCLRWRHRSRSIRSVDNQLHGLALLPAELDAVLLQWIRVVQSRYYQEEMTAIENKRGLARSSHLRTLSPYMNEHGVLRVGGRLKHAALSFDERHPLIVPPRSWLTRLLVEAYHRRTLHGGA
ncbi:PREDICTED: uncharacterized protein LOC105145719 [Acromyrmex echinatior]|uniref:uncharacterized protein LOC105145719 n=1 Tax=Acromyrmex echinatior TaxID=103372 RepID=UPI000580E0CA|nr:PREDICTED: uncharacterized protein LOC105145719 [Acromyrmex echinatior]